jgi:hypothetical protein
LVEAWFPNLNRFNLVLGLSEVLGHLDLLADEGRLIAMRRNGVVYYVSEPAAGRRESPADDGRPGG